MNLKTFAHGIPFNLCVSIFSEIRNEFAIFINTADISENLFQE